MRSLPITLSIIVACVARLAAAAAEDPTARTTALLSAFKKVRTAPEGAKLSPADAQANQAIFKELDGFFDFKTLASKTIAPHKGKLTPEQQSKVQSTLSELIRLVSYPSSGAFLRSAKYDLRPGKTNGNSAQVVMHAAVPKDDFETDIAFVWEEQGGTYRIVDVTFDGSSLVADYANQFGRIIEKEGSEGLVKKLETRLNKERQKQGV